MAFNIFKILCCLFAVCAFSAPPAIAQSSESIETTAPAHKFEKKRYKIEGSASLVKGEAGLEIQFSNDFKTKGGPDLKVYLSKKPLAMLDSQTVNQNSRKIGVLKAKSGAQSYIIPDDIDLSDYQSVIIHCEAFSVLWGGFDLR